MGDARGKTPPEDGDDEIAVFRFAAPGAKIGDDAAPAIGVAAGLGPLRPMGSLTGILRPLLGKGAPLFLDAIKEIEEAGIIPEVMAMAEVTLATAEDAKQYGALKADPQSVECIAYIMNCLLYTSPSPRDA